MKARKGEVAGLPELTSFLLKSHDELNCNKKASAALQKSYFWCKLATVIHLARHTNTHGLLLIVRDMKEMTFSNYPSVFKNKYSSKVLMKR